MRMVSIATALPTLGWRFCCIVMSVYFLALLPTLFVKNFDPSVFIVAGDVFVDATKAASPILIKHHSYGYDGQFYYRLAVSPLTFTRSAFGVTMDSPPAWRTQRIGYPIAAWALSFGQARWVPVALVLVNLVALGAVAWFSAQLTAKLRLSGWIPILIVIWPGFIYTLTRDTTEILAAALMLAALNSYFGERLFLYLVLAAGASLTRETSILIFGGIFLFEAFRFCRDPKLTARGLVPMLITASVVLPFLAWRYAQLYLWGELPTTRDLGFPLAGIFEALRYSIAGVVFSSSSTDALTTDLQFISAVSLVFIIIFGCTVASCLRSEAFARKAGLVNGWILISVLVISLRADGPFIGPHAFLRALTEWYVVGCLLLPAEIPAAMVSYLRAGVVLIWLTAWTVSFLQVVA
jgi:hypothetical protein